MKNDWRNRSLEAAADYLGTVIRIVIGLGNERLSKAVVPLLDKARTLILRARDEE